MKVEDQLRLLNRAILWWILLFLVNTILIAHFYVEITSVYQSYHNGCPPFGLSFQTKATILEFMLLQFIKGVLCLHDAEHNFRDQRRIQCNWLWLIQTVKQQNAHVMVDN